jgi:hypothetical protein
MKKQIFRALIFVAISLSIAVSANAQIVNGWKGGHPGHETDWHFFKNWSFSRTPDVFDQVVILDVSTTTRHYPVVSPGEEIEVQSIEIQPNAMLTLRHSARILTEKFACAGTCKGCESRILIDGSDVSTAASSAH